MTAHQRPDVIVVGGGVNGCSAAYRLAQTGKRVLLLEKRGLASGASGRNGGMTNVGSSMHAQSGDAVYALTKANFALLRELAEELDADFEFRTPGGLNIAVTPEHETHLRESVIAQRAAGLDVHWLDRDQARELMPALSEHIRGAEFTPDAGHLWPFALVHGFANAARRCGARIEAGVTVERLLRQGDRVIGVVADGQKIEADDVVLATNAYTPTILPDLPAGAIVPARGQILVTQPLPPILPHSFGTNFDKEYGRQVPGGQILCGGYRRLDEDEGLGHYEERVTAPVLSGIARCLTTLFPQLSGVNVVRCWSGIMGFTADGLPLIGKMPGTPGLMLAAGFNGGGFSWAAITGKIVAAELTETAHGFDLRPFDPGRFARNGIAWSNPFTAGERSNTAGLGAAAAV